MRALVTGSTGYIGRTVIKRLHRLGHEVYALLHNPSRAHLLPSGTQSVNTTDVLSMKESLDAIIHLAYSPSLGTRAALRDNISLMRKVIHISEVTGARLVFSSSIAVAGYRIRPDFNYSTPLKRISWDDTYTVVKGTLEKILTSTCKKCRIPYSIVRIGNVLGPGSTWAAALLDQLWHPTSRLAGFSNSTEIGNLADTIITEAMSEDGQHLAVSAEFADVPWRRWLNAIGGQPRADVGALGDESRERHLRLDTAVNDWLKSLITTHPVFALAYHIMPEAAVRAAATRLKVPIIDRHRPLRPSITTCAVFDAMHAVPSSGLQLRSFEDAAADIRNWADWSGYFAHARTGSK